MPASAKRKVAISAPKAFRTQAEFRDWLEKHHAGETELMLRLYKTSARHLGIGYREALDESLCYGWIDGVRRALDDVSFVQRFTPRRPRSNWSSVNIRRVRELEAEGRMRPPGLAAFNARDVTKIAPYSFESKALDLDRAFIKRFRANKGAWRFFDQQPPWYRRTTTFWVMSAKRHETRARRFETLLECSARGKSIPGLERTKS
jgi:uncharacterized protein YdeI (YjbR/CyaY-like superfamily)